MKFGIAFHEVLEKKGLGKKREIHVEIYIIENK